QAAGDDGSFGVAERDNVAFLKFALRADDSGGEQAAAFFDDGLSRALVELNSPADLSREAEPALKGADAFPLTDAQRAGGFAGHDLSQDIGAVPAGDDHVFAGGGDHAGRLELAGHSALALPRFAVANIG